MKNNVSSFTQEIGQINQRIESLNKSMGKYVKDIRQGVREKSFPQKRTIVDRVSRATQQSLPPPSASGIDYKRNPLFLRVADYFGIDWKEYPLAVSKISEIIDWAASEVGSNNVSDIILKIANTSKTLKSGAYSEKPYAVLYRYTKLSSDKKALDKAIQPTPVDTQKIKQEQQNVQKEMQAYHA